MLHPLDRNIGTQDMPEEIDLRAAETLACARRRANWTMVFQQKEALPVLVPFGHVAFARADFRQAGDA